MQDDQKKMQDHHWLGLYMAAVFFDILGWMAGILDIICLGWCGFFLNIFVILIFLMWALIWKDKLGNKFFVNLAIVASIGEAVTIIPIIGITVDFLPKWVGLIYWVKKIYIKGAIGMVSGKISSGTDKLSGAVKNKLGNGITGRVGQATIRRVGSETEKLLGPGHIQVEGAMV